MALTYIQGGFHTLKFQDEKASAGNNWVVSLTTNGMHSNKHEAKAECLRMIEEMQKALTEGKKRIQDF
jgi:hypothetical protein